MQSKCNIVELMKVVIFNRYLKVLLLRGVAILLMTLVLMVSSIESFHHHETAHVHSEKSVGDSYSKYHLLKSASCQICAYLSVRQVQISLSFIFPDGLGLPATTTPIDTPYLAASFNAQVHSWTNKGPPAIC